MTPRLIAISGSLKGTTFALAQDEISIGRDLSNTVSLNDPSVSRRHCLINKNGSTDGFHIVDLESYNGTFVNGLPVAQQSLTHGDQIAAIREEDPGRQGLRPRHHDQLRRTASGDDGLDGR